MANVKRIRRTSRIYSVARRLPQGARLPPPTPGRLLSDSETFTLYRQHAGIVNLWLFFSCVSRVIFLIRNRIRKHRSLDHPRCKNSNFTQTLGCIIIYYIIPGLIYNILFDNYRFYIVSKLLIVSSKRIHI